ncbi:hypothetical protein E4665_16445 [Sporolactobacillus shoreae]|uniref:HPr family phosphocarrier protein n=1 Tax=Sporolactobacillus shoreae TaxID=1465501 RepID=A0A4Z0GJU5_9BACL|nr:hypothetical protein [Sporolactobacillus shoreae]TGA96186.1 hypothetical protein E4665_16445 [Sporolactobacillus shoreae]
MTKQIVSIKVPLKSMNTLTLKRALRLYETIKKSHCTAYFSIDGKTFSVRELPKTLSFLSSIRTKEVLLVIEGENAEALNQQIKGSIQTLKENARENPGLYRQNG